MSAYSLHVYCAQTACSSSEIDEFQFMFWKYHDLEGVRRYLLYE